MKYPPSVHPFPEITAAVMSLKVLENLFKTREVCVREAAEGLFENSTFFVGQSAPESQDGFAFDALGGTCWEMSRTEVWMVSQLISK